MMKPDSLFDFSGKVVLVTGGSRGLAYQMVRPSPRGAPMPSWAGPTSS